MKLDNKRINVLEGVALALLLLLLLYLEHITVIDHGYSFPYLVLAYLILIKPLSRKLKAKYDPEALRKEDEEDAMIQWVKVPPSIAGCLCDVVTIILLIATWTLIAKRGLFNPEDRETSGIFVMYTAFCLIYLVMSYVPKPMGGSIKWGMKQLKRLVFRSHAMALIGALIGFFVAIEQIHESEWLSVLLIVLVVALMTLFLGKYFMTSVKKNEDKAIDAPTEHDSSNETTLTSNHQQS